VQPNNRLQRTALRAAAEPERTRLRVFSDRGDHSMPMGAFSTKFRDLAFRETRTLTVTADETLPEGEYGFLEFYCNEAGYVCRRVVLRVVRSDTRARVWASINFGWESVAFYRRWSRRDPDPAVMAGATLDPLNPQSRHADALLDLFREMEREDPEYVSRLVRHYRLFKGSGPVSDAGHGAQPQSPLEGGSDGA